MMVVMTEEPCGDGDGDGGGDGDEVMVVMI